MDVSPYEGWELAGAASAQAQAFMLSIHNVEVKGPSDIETNDEQAECNSSGQLAHARDVRIGHPWHF
jgi:hypothetical protein